MHNPLNYHQEINRKFIHLSSSSIPFMLWYFGKDSFQPWIIAIAIILPFLDYGRRNNKFLYRIYSKLFTGFTRPIEQGILSGASWVIIGAAITICKICSLRIDSFSSNFKNLSVLKSIVMRFRRFSR